MKPKVDMLLPSQYRLRWRENLTGSETGQKRKEANFICFVISSINLWAVTTATKKMLRMLPVLSEKLKIPL